MSTSEKWQLMFQGVASTPDYAVRVGDTFKESLKGDLVCTLPECNTSSACKVRERARLIAAAPDLLAALIDMEKDMVEAMRRHNGLVGSVRQGTLGNAIQAIAKATGGTL